MSLLHKLGGLTIVDAENFSQHWLAPFRTPDDDGVTEGVYSATWPTEHSPLTTAITCSDDLSSASLRARALADALEQGAFIAPLQRRLSATIAVLRRVDTNDALRKALDAAEDTRRPRSRAA